MRSRLWMGFAFFCSFAAHASIRCGSCLVSEGDFTSQLYLCCGQPDAVDHTSYVDPIRPWETVDANIDFLTYNCGSSRFMQRIKVIDGKIVGIENIGRGAGPQKCF